MEENIIAGGSIILENRKKLTLSGVTEVVNFDDETLVLKTKLGKLTVKGEGIHISEFNTDMGDLNADGRFTALVYTSEDGKSGVFSRIFR